MTELIRTSKAGNDAVVTSTPGSLTYSSDYNTLKYYTSGTVTLTPAGTNTQTTIQHNLGYTPFFVALSDNLPTGGYAICPITFSDAGFYTYVQAYADDVFFYLKIATNSNVGTFHLKYFLFRNNLGI